MMDKMNPMKKALAMRRGNGIDINIMLGEPEEDMKRSDKAPRPAGPLEKDMPKELQAEAAMEGETPMQELVEQEQSMGHEDADMDAEMLGRMSEFDKQDLTGRKPRSLGERARQAAMERSTK